MVAHHVYNPQSLDHKLHFLHKIHNLQGVLGEQHWIIGGDFKIITYQKEKEGVIQQLKVDSANF